LLVSSRGFRLLAYERQAGNWILLPDSLAVAVSMLVEVDEI